MGEQTAGGLTSCSDIKRKAADWVLIPPTETIPVSDIDQDTPAYFTVNPL